MQDLLSLFWKCDLRPEVKDLGQAHRLPSPGLLLTPVSKRTPDLKFEISDSAAQSAEVLVPPRKQVGRVYRSFLKSLVRIALGI